ncbi:MAG: GNAT family N-acetyltransferase [Herpetosiphonaceae bacterium]|nr:GNAT family N-acetyltransferase [Herpetosiphonaceae bacterium]
MNFKLETWDPADPRWPALWQAVEQLDQVDWMQASYDWHRGSQVFVAADAAGRVGGFLRIVLQDIGLEDDCDPVVFNGETLREAKVLAFGVLPELRGQGIGRALQLYAIQQARALGCYQLRSHSGGESQANHRLKLALGSAISPTLRGADTAGAYFIIPLRLAAEV